MTELTADAFAHAIIAAARSYGDHPVAAMLAKRGRLRRSLAPAIVGLHQATGVDVRRLGTIAGIGVKNVYWTRAQAGEPFDRATKAAEAAVRAELKLPLVQPIRRHVAAVLDEAQAPAAADAPPASPAPPPAPAKPSTADMLAKAIRERARTTPPPPPVRPALEPRHDAYRAPVRLAAPPPVPVLSLGGRILAELAYRPLTGTSLASILGEKEAIVGQALSVLRYEGRVSCDAPPPEGERFKAWRLVESAIASRGSQ